ncbi:MAG: trypsin-like peptidase domain-containing protein [Burkholderiaceae bacterium]|nr:trypsin-like peptidase domain-containing protein [Burkholderiaceae bacterium]
MQRRTLLRAAPLTLLAPAAAPTLAALPEVVAANRPAVVALGTYRETDNPRFSFRGTGFAVGDGMTLVTNAHVLPDAASADPDARLVLQLGRPGPTGEGQYQVRSLALQALDREHDLALLRLESGPPLPTLRLAAAEAVREGQAVAFIGFPIGGALGFSPVTHRGIVASITPIQLPPPSARQLDAAAVARARRGAVFEILQLDATAYPGNSGGPLFDAQTGEVVGVLNMVFVKAGRESALSQPTGISYAIPVRWVHALLASRQR